MHSKQTVPAAPFRAMIEKRLAELEFGGFEEAPIDRVALELGLDAARVYRIRKVLPRLEFSVADVIVSRLGGGLMTWLTNPELLEIYESVDFAREDLINPLDNDFARAEADRRVLEAWDNSSSRGEAAGKLGLSLDAFSPKLNGALERAGREAVQKRRQQTHCKYGHEIAVHGRDAGGDCRVCARERASRRKPRSQAPHGTVGGYQRCRKTNGEACQPCKSAWAEYYKAYRKRVAA